MNLRLSRLSAFRIANRALRAVLIAVLFAVGASGPGIAAENIRATERPN